MASDLYKYFRIEARELADDLGQGVLALEKGASGEGVSRLLRLAHTLKGAARVVKKGEIAKHAHAIEEVLEPYRHADRGVPRAQIDELLARVDAISNLVKELERPAEQAPRVTEFVTEEPLRAARGGEAELDALLEGISEAGVHVRGVRGALSRLEEVKRLAREVSEQAGVAGARDGGGAALIRTRAAAEELKRVADRLERTLTVSVDLAERELEQARDIGEQLRLVPLGVVFGSLERTVRDVAQTLGKQAAFEGKGGDIRVDAHVVAELQAALVQAVRNAVAHGIELPGERVSAGKSPVGRVAIDVVRRGSRVVLFCQDDGRGIDVEAARLEAIRAGFAPKDGSILGVDAVLELLFRGGISTSSTVTEMSGRGIGLDVVRATVSRLGGSAILRTQPGRGTTLELSVPVSLQSVHALVVEAGGVPAAIPLDAVRRTLRLVASDVVHTPEGEAILHDGNVIPFAPLARSLHGKTALDARALSAVVVQAQGGLIAIGVDRLLGAEVVVVRPLPRLAPADPMVAGASLDREGIPQLVLAPEGLVALARGARSPEVVPERPGPPPSS